MQSECDCLPEQRTWSAANTPSIIQTPRPVPSPESWIYHQNKHHNVESTCKSMSSCRKAQVDMNSLESFVSFQVTTALSTTLTGRDIKSSLRVLSSHKNRALTWSWTDATFCRQFVCAILTQHSAVTSAGTKNFRESMCSEKDKGTKETCLLHERTTLFPRLNVNPCSCT